MPRLKAFSFDTCGDMVTFRIDGEGENKQVYVRWDGGSDYEEPVDNGEMKAFVEFLVSEFYNPNQP